MDSGSRKTKKIISSALTGEYQLPRWVAVFILVAGLAVLGGYYGLKHYKSYEVRQADKERATEATLLTQQQELAKAKEEIDALKTGRNSDKRAEGILASQLEGRLATIVKEWRPRVASIECRWDGFFGEETSKGSGLWVSSDNTIITSNHVVTKEDVFIGPSVKADSCSVKFPGGEELSVNKEDISDWRGVAQVAALKIKNPSSAMRQTASTLNSVCRAKAASGDRVVVLGYPAIGVKGDVTATEGIISGYEGSFYITSAKIEQGVSGGVAVLVDKNCYLGIPTFVRAGEVESLGRILDSSLLIR